MPAGDGRDGLEHHTFRARSPPGHKPGQPEEPSCRGHSTARHQPLRRILGLWRFVRPKSEYFHGKHRSDAWRMLVALGVFLILPGLAYLFLRPESDGSNSAVGFFDWSAQILGIATTSSERRSALDVYDWLERVPTEPAFGYSIAAIVGAYVSWRWCLSDKLRKRIIKTEEEDKNEKSTLTPHDWWVVQDSSFGVHSYRRS